MSDEADRGNDAAQFFLEIALLVREFEKTSPWIPRGIGMCLNCAAELEGEARWCDADCRSDWERVQLQRQNKVAYD